MELFILFIIFCIGSLIGSFLTLAVHRVPLKQDITHTRSYCPKCNHKLNFLDLIPILSYIFLRGKCRYCKNKIRPRYFILEISSGILFVLFTLSLNINIFFLEVHKLVYLLFSTLYIIGILLIAGIDKEYRNINKYGVIYLIFTITGYMIYLYVLKFNIYRYAIYLLAAIIILIFNKQRKYFLDIFMLCLLMASFGREEVLILTAIITLAIFAMKKIKKNANLAFILSITNIIIIILHNFIVGDYIRWLI